LKKKENELFSKNGMTKKQNHKRIQYESFGHDKFMIKLGKSIIATLFDYYSNERQLKYVLWLHKIS